MVPTEQCLPRPRPNKFKLMSFLQDQLGLGGNCSGLDRHSREAICWAAYKTMGCRNVLIHEPVVGGDLNPTSNGWISIRLINTSAYKYTFHSMLQVSIYYLTSPNSYACVNIGACAGTIPSSDQRELQHLGYQFSN